jgi:hypothetical protein
MTPTLLLLAVHAITLPPALRELADWVPGSPTSLPAPASCEGPPENVRVGYEPGTPPARGGNDTRAMRVLSRAFPPPCFSLVLQSYRREDLAPSLVAGRIDVGIIGVASAASYAEQGVTSLPARQTQGVDTLMLHPASYSVVSTQPTATPSVIPRPSSSWLLVPGGALVGVAALCCCVYLLNFKLPRLDRLSERARTQLDPRLTGLAHVTHWLYRSLSGRLLALLWAGLGALLALQTLSARALTDAAAPGESQYQRGAELAAYPGRDVYEFRNDHWKKCPRAFQCLVNYEQGNSQALAGDRDVLCRAAEETQATALSFRPEIAVPMMYALLLPNATKPLGGAGSPSAKEAILQALAREPYTGSPWRPCDPPLATAENAY